MSILTEPANGSAGVARHGQGGDVAVAARCRTAVIRSRVAVADPSSGPERASREARTSERCGGDTLSSARQACRPAPPKLLAG